MFLTGILRLVLEWANSNMLPLYTISSQCVFFFNLESLFGTHLPVTKQRDW